MTKKTEPKTICLSSRGGVHNSRNLQKVQTGQDHDSI